MLSKEIITNIRNNKDLITPELLQELRTTEEGKHIAIEILELPKDNEMYTLDSFKSRVTFNGNRGLKKEFTQLPLSNIHKIELRKCQEDIHYFKDNYVKIVTPKGVTFPFIRDYQNDFLSTVSDDYENIVCLMPRQCCSQDTLLSIEDNGVSSDMTFEELFKRCKDEYNE